MLLRHLREFHPVTLCAKEESKYKQMLWCSAVVTASEEMPLMRQKISRLAIFSCLGMSQHHGPWLRIPTPTLTVVRCDPFLFLGSFPQTHPGLWLISLCSHVLWSTEVFGRRSAEWLYLLLFPWHHLCLCLVFRPCVTIGARPWDHSRDRLRFLTVRSETQRCRPRFWTVSNCPSAPYLLYGFNYLVARYICWACTHKCVSLGSRQGWNLKAELQIQFPSAPPAPERQYWSAGYLSDPKPASASSRITFPHLIREVEPSAFNILHMLEWFD